MSAGSGVVHSEFNPSGTEPVHFLQIWIEPATTGTKPSYEQFAFDPAEKRGRLKLLASPEGGDGVAGNPAGPGARGVARINADAKVFVSELADGQSVTYPLGVKRYAWLHLVRGAVTVNGTALQTGDAVAVSAEDALTVTGADAKPSEVLLFDLA
jgi:hypothetical protein